MKTNERRHNPGPQPTPRKYRKKMVTREKYYIEANERHNPSTQPNPRNFRKKCLEVHDFDRVCSSFFLCCVGLGLPSSSVL